MAGDILGLTDGSPLHLRFLGCVVCTVYNDAARVCVCRLLRSSHRRKTGSVVVLDQMCAPYVGETAVER